MRDRHLKLPSLYYKRSCGDMIHVYVLMMHGGVDVSTMIMMKMHNSGVTRGHSLKLSKPLAS